MRCLALPLLLAVALIPPAVTRAEPPAYQELYEQANRSSQMWKERAAILEKENQNLRDQLARPRGPQPPMAPQANRMPMPAQPRKSQIEIPMYGAVNLESYGGPAIKVNIWSASVKGALVQVGNEARRQVDFGPDGRVLLHRDASGEFQVFLLGTLSSPSTVRIEIVQAPR